MADIMIGINVDIQRTDGRVHSAIISGINVESRSVTVEWYEKGEAKGKEIEFEAIYQLNPSLQPNQFNDENSRPTREPQRNNQVPAQISKIPAASIPVSRSRLSVRPSALPSHQVANNVPSHQVAPPAPAPAPAVALPSPQEDSSTDESPTAEPFRPPPPPLQEPAAKKHSVLNKRRRRTPSASPVSRRSHSIILSVNPSSISNAPAAVPNRAGGGGVGGGGGGGGARKSSCLNEIEKIQKRREERRAAQKAVREQPEFDPSNPNYDFLMMIKEYQEKLDYRPITNADHVSEHRICVCVRKRPLNKKELNRKEIVVLTIPNKEDVVVHEPKFKVDLTKYLENQTFRFDYAFDECADNEIVYRYTAKPLVECIFEGGMATCFAYGQTGSGKTHTMGGEFSGRGQQDCSKGIYALAARDVFKLLGTKYKKDNLIVEAAFFEIYSGKVFDLLNKKQKLRVLEDHKSQVQVVGLKEEPIERVDDVLRLLQTGNHMRTSGQTSANQHSSRSHAVFQIILKKKQTRKLFGKFSLIDLAGNERGADTSSSDRITRMEGAEINKSLLALKECIRALGRKGAHLPFRASKLTQVLRDSFIGDKSRTCMIAMVSPGMSCCEHTLNTLRYADRVKELAPNGPPAERRVGVPDDAGMSPGDSTLTNEIGDFRLDEDLLSNEEDDLKMLRSANADEVSEDLLTFHNVINQCEKLEEEVLDDHKQIIDEMIDWTKDHKKLYNSSTEVDYDIDSYAAQLESRLTQQLEKLNALRTKVVVWREEMREEEEISTKMYKMKQAGVGRPK